MRDVVTLTLRSPVEGRLEVEGIAGDRFLGLGESEIAQLPAWRGREALRLGDVFHVRGERSSRIRIEGSMANLSGLAAGMASGEVIVDGDAGDRVGAEMTGGSVRVIGNVGHDAGLAMAGGTLQVSGSAGHRLGAGESGAAKGMTGGEIVVAGSAGDGAASRCRRGLVVVGADVGVEAARGMIAGTLVVLGRVGDHPGRGCKRGSIVARAFAAIPATYSYACTYAPPHVRLVVTYVERRYGLAVEPGIREGLFRRYCGDSGVPGRGELLEWAGQHPGAGKAGPAI